MSWLKKRIILKRARLSGCDVDGDIIYYKGKAYYVCLYTNMVKQIKGVEYPFYGRKNKLYFLFKKFTGRFPFV